MVADLTSRQSTRAKYDSTRPLALMHVPKTAGTSLTFGLHQVLQPKIAAHGLGRHIFGPFDRFETIPEKQRIGIHLTPESLPVNADLVGGHITLSTLRARYPNAQVITVLREPISRLLSQWLFWRAWPWPEEDFWGDWREMLNHSRWPLYDFLNDTDLITSTDNVSVRMLLEPVGVEIDKFIDPKDDSDLLRAALDALETFSWTDIVENSHWEENLGNWLGKPFPLLRANQMPVLPPELTCRLEDELDHKTLELLRIRTRLDLVLWQRVAEWRELDHSDLRVGAILRSVARYTATARGISG